MATKTKVVSTKSSIEGKISPLTIKNARLIYKNFSGVAKKYNAKGLRNFHILLDPDIATILEKDGWNIKWDDPKEEGDNPVPHIKVALRFDIYPPRIVLITKNGRSVLDEDSVEILDWAEIEKADLVLTGSRWDVQGKQGIKAWLRKAFITLSDDDLESEYAIALSPDRNDEDD
jgi:hypothetical protein